MTNTQELLDNVKINLLRLGCNQPFVCPYNERTLSYATGVQVPVPDTPPEEIFKECCYVHYVFADINSNDDIKNDFSSFFHQKQVQNETVDFILVDMKNAAEIDLNVSTYGEYFDFGSFQENTNLKGYKVEWKKVLESLGEGPYKILKRITIVGISVETESLVYTLNQYSTTLANHTVRIDINMNGFLRKMNVDFTGVNWKHSIRVPGFFGNREPQFEEDILIRRSFEAEQISMSQTNEYKFQTNLIPSCVTNEIWDFFIFANDIFITDYNLNNHSYDFQKFPVKYFTNDATDYNPRRRKARLNLVFSDKTLDNRKNNYY